MAEGDRAAVRVHLLWVEASPLAHVGQALRGEGLVELEYLDVLPAGEGTLMAAQGERVLGLPRDAVDPGQFLRALSERDRPLLWHLRVDHPPAQRARVKLLVLAGERPLGLEQDPRRAAHRFDA